MEDVANLKSHDISLQSSHVGHGLFYGWWILGTVFLASLLAWGFYYSFGVFFDDLQRTFGANRADVSLISSIFIFTLYITCFFYGWAVDRFSPRILTIFGGLFLFAGLILSSRASSLWQLYVSSGFMAGLGTGATFVPYISIISRWFVKRRGLAIGLMAAGSGAGMMIIPPVSQALLVSVGWRTTFVLMGVGCLVLFALAAYVVRRRPEEKGFLPYGVEASQDKNDSPKRQTSGSATAIAPEKNVSFGEAMRGKDTWLLLGMRIFLSLTIFMVNLHLVNFGSDTGLSRASAAFLMSIVGGASIFGKIGAGHLVDTTGSKKIILACAGLMAAIMFWLASPMGSQMLQLSAVVYGIAYGGSYALFNTVVAETFGVPQMGKIIGVVNIGSAAGSLVGPWLAGYIFDSTGNYSIAFLVGAIASVISVILTIPLGKRVKRVGQEIH